MSAIKRTIVAVAAIGGLFAGAGVISPVDAGAQAGPTITITNQGDNYTFAPADLAAKVGDTITVTNNDPRGVHSVTAQDRSFNVDVPPKGSATFTVDKAGNFPYGCIYHTNAHNPASINVS